MQFLENLKWRYATKQFDPTKKIDDQTMGQLAEAMQLSATSFGLQFFKVLNVKDKAVREQLKSVSFGQEQITDASHLLVFGHYHTINDQKIDEFIDYTASVRKQQVEDLYEYSQMMKAYINSRPSKESWAARQVYLVLGTLLMAAAEMRIDTCPIEGFDENAYDEILGMKEKGLHTTVVVALGYRSDQDGYQHAPKVRRSREELFADI